MIIFLGSTEDRNKKVLLSDKHSAQINDGANQSSALAYSHTRAAHPLSFLISPHYVLQSYYKKTGLTITNIYARQENEGGQL